MEKENRKWIPMAAAFGVALVFLFGYAYFSFFRTWTAGNANISLQNINYVLVNEDRGAEFNGIEYNLGSEFVNLVNQDPALLWHTASRSVATAGLDSGAYDVMIILPQNFSENLLSLQSFTPERARVFYEVRIGHSDTVRAHVLETVGLVLRDFNNRVIQMYFSSILGNLFEAQQNVRGITLGEQAVI